MLCVMTYELVLPTTQALALTSGPSQPEVQSFEPVGTTEMVDLFSGDFVYNIPLMDVEGYPINISYHSGINMEQEASWVGLGWNINAGEINRGVRGLPDDFSGEVVKKRLNIKEEKDYRMALGVNAGFELFGALNLGISLSQYISYNNYKGIGVGTNVGASLSTPYVNTGIGLGIGSLEGADVDVTAGLTFSTSTKHSDGQGYFGASAGTGFNTRSGLKNISYGVDAGIYRESAINKNQDMTYRQQSLFSYGSYIPIGMQNYVPVVTNATTLKSFSVQVKLGLEVMWAYPHFNTSLSYSRMKYDRDGSMPAYGYLYAQNANEKSIMDFSRERDGVYNHTLSNLPLSSMTYDVFSVSGQGTGGMFRPMRNDIGSVFDPVVSSQTTDNSFVLEFGVGTGFGGLFEFGADMTFYRNRVESGPWFRRRFRGNSPGSFYESAYFKQAGEMTYSQQQTAPGIAGHDPVYVNPSQQLRGRGDVSAGSLPQVYGGTGNRSPRANHISTLTTQEASIQDVAVRPRIQDYPRNVFLNNNASIKTIARYGAAYNKAKAHHIGEMTQVLPDGRRYVYGIPAMNNLQREVTFSVENGQRNEATGLVHFTAGQVTPDNNVGRENYYQETYTPAYAHSYLLTEALSPDYVDVTGDGPSEDDLGSYTKFNYSRVDSDYRWIAPYQAIVGQDSAQYAPGFWSDPKDDKGNYVIGSKEVWHQHSIETKNYVAEFYTSLRPDGKGVLQAVGNAGLNNSGVEGSLMSDKTTSSRSFQLDSIKLYNKHDRLASQANATPIKTVVFVYDYSLCKKVPNTSSIDTNSNGKLTLRRIYFKYGKSDKSLVNPYVFTYDNASNRPYNFAEKDRWGNYKPTDPTITNYEFPYVKQDKTAADANCSSWHLSEIRLPSGGVLKINYEADDYSYVQNKRAMEMFKVAGVGNSVLFEPKDVLYENIDQPYDYIYFLRDPSRELPGKSMKENYLGNSDLLYFSFNVDIAARNRYEYIKGYARVEEVGECSGNGQYGYVKVKRESAGGKSDKMLNPVTLAGLNTGRYYLPHIIYPGYNDGDEGSGAEVLRGLVAAAGEMLSLFQNANVRFVKNGLAQKFVVNKSWVRLNTPGYTKLGGGTRVKRLTLEDSWNQMAPNGEEASYGKDYDYTTQCDDDRSVRISSGVASYEPMIGADENPLRMPVRYTADQGKLLPAIDFYQEEPFGESFYPAPTVGYSKVTVTSIHKNTARSAKAEDVHEFHTAKDFPIETEFTEKSVPVDVRTKSLSNKSEELQVVQGYVLRMNDMHGKPKAVSNFVLKKKTGTSGEERELVTGVRYNYQVDAQGKLSNKVNAVVRGNLINPVYSVAETTLGEDVDFTVDNRQREMESQSTTVSFNLNTVNFAFVVIPIPTMFFPDRNENSLFRTMVSTKVIQQYGILKSVEQIDHEARTLSENMLYDSETGNVLLTRVNNEYNDPVSNLSYPAYWAYDNMGPSYYNVGYEQMVDSIYVDNFGKAHLLNLSSKYLFNEGDELLMRLYDNNVLKQFRVWITGPGSYCIGGGGSSSSSGGGAVPMAGGGCIESNNCTIVAEPRAVYPTGNGVPWLAMSSKFKNVYVKVLRSGRRNQLVSTVQNLSVAGPYAANNFPLLFDNATAFANVLSASASTFSQNVVNTQFTNTGNYLFNKYVLGEKGNFREAAGYTYQAPRKYSNNHVRRDGVFQSYASPWSLSYQQTIGTCNMDDYALVWTNNTNWQKVKEVTRYSPYGMPLEEKDAANTYSTALYGYNHSLPVAVGSNAKYNQMRYYNFEDALQYLNTNQTSLGIWGLLPPTNGSYGFLNSSYGRTYARPVSNNIFVKNGAIYTNTGPTGINSHTGLYCLASGLGSSSVSAELKLGNVADYPSQGDLPNHCYASLWARTATSVPSAGSLLIRAVRADGTSQNFKAFAQKTNSIDGWAKYEGRIDMKALAGFVEFFLLIGDDIYVDDVRICPDRANMKSFAYNLSNLRLMAELDENNFATFYEYDQEGVLVRVKKETERGILTVNEHRKSNAKIQ